MSFSGLKSLDSPLAIAVGMTGVPASVGTGSFLICGHCCATETRLIRSSRARCPRRFSKPTVNWSARTNLQIEDSPAAFAKPCRSTRPTHYAELGLRPPLNLMWRCRAVKNLELRSARPERCGVGARYSYTSPVDVDHLKSWDRAPTDASRSER
jgi:hypothetical protein